MAEYLYAWVEEDVQESDGGYPFLGMMYYEARCNGPFLMVTDRHGNERICLEEGCAFLDGGNWNVETFDQPLVDKEVKEESKEKEQMTKQIKVGTPVKLIKNTAGSDHKIGDVGTVVMKHRFIDRCWLVEVDGYSEVDKTYSYESDLEVLTENKTPVTPSLEGLNRLQLRTVIREAKDLLDTEEVTLYSVAGRNWGKKRIPETKLKMTYTLCKGVIQGQPKVENV